MTSCSGSNGMAAFLVRSSTHAWCAMRDTSLSGQMSTWPQPAKEKFALVARQVRPRRAAIAETMTKDAITTARAMPAWTSIPHPLIVMCSTSCQVIASHQREGIVQGGDLARPDLAAHDGTAEPGV